MSDLIDRLRRPGDYTGVWAIGADTAAEAADALEAKDRLIQDMVIHLTMYAKAIDILGGESGPVHSVLSRAKELS